MGGSWPAGEAEAEATAVAKAVEKSDEERQKMHELFTPAKNDYALDDGR